MILIKIFILSLLFNIIWEFLHAKLYLHYKGGLITNRVLLRASFVDALFITAMSIFFVNFSYLSSHLWWAIIFGFIASWLLEKYALKNNRWKYKDSMPIIPILKTGLTPTVQIGLIAWLVYLILI